MDKYYFHYNPKDRKYYVDSNYPLRSSKRKVEVKNNIPSNIIETNLTIKDSTKFNHVIEQTSSKNKLFDSLIKNAPEIIETLPTILSLVKMFKNKN
ncbi:hypothetical protein ABFY54_01930 [Priestia megaterium]|uniref:hypothetical protein n=1 Tax=Priestia megaterium TaxID=1404 RepID=UPI003D2D0B2C